MRINTWFNMLLAYSKVLHAPLYRFSYYNTLHYREDAAPSITLISPSKAK